MIGTGAIWRALDVMKEKANENGIEGVAAILIRSVGEVLTLSPKFLVCGKSLRPAGERGPNDPGTDYFAIAWSKIAEMIYTGEDSGQTKIVPKGEFGFRGGCMVDTGKFVYYAAFSGGTEDEDVGIALTGLMALGFSPADTD